MKFFLPAMSKTFEPGIHHARPQTRVGSKSRAFYSNPGCLIDQTRSPIYLCQRRPVSAFQSGCCRLCPCRTVFLPFPALLYHPISICCLLRLSDLCLLLFRALATSLLEHFYNWQ